MWLSDNKHSHSEITDLTELDVTPVMNMFIILIPFLVSMAVFTHLSIIEFSLPPNAVPSMNSSLQNQSSKLTVRIGNDYIGIVIDGQILDSIPVENGVYPFAELAERLTFHKRNTIVNEELIVAATDSVPIEQVVRVMDFGRDAGFMKIGLSVAEKEVRDEK
ncbi:MAG: biopolymer transporter ExbD [Fibrobacter sp.]|nr:biopolymer transporter ExbD [Fibrobacter sp.]